MKTYIKSSYYRHYVVFEQELNPRFNSIGTTWEDYKSDKYILLSDEQVKFHEDHPEATVKQVWDMNIPVPPTPPVPTPEERLENARRVKISAIRKYDNSPNVNSFYLGNTVAWLDKATRVGLQLRFDAEKRDGVVDTSLWYDNTLYTLPIDIAVDMLYQIEIYASQCYDNTQQHINNILSLTSEEEIKEYDYTLGYPEKLSFTI